ncbi:hypothetical protein LCGC14_1741610 [marine sediment metagenome]|uniref:Dephospho-CoA kinase n=1 Tax=marine sediment metagenome TaxID=412755 RepID=A0A0F9K680_9ZZZZ|nr:hypothetical protein [bacterium]
MKIIGITGTLGAGKGTIVDYLVKQNGFKHYSVRAFLTDEINKRGLVVNRDSMVEVANELRTKNSPSYIVEQLYEQALIIGENCIIESLRTPGEVEALQNKGNFHLFAADAEPKIRYDRITGRGSETDQVSFTEFVQNEEREMHSDDPNKQNLSKCISMADHVFHNNGTIEELSNKIKEVIDVI